MSNNNQKLFCPNCNSNFYTNYSHSCVYNLKLSALSERYSTFDSQFKEIQSQVKSRVSVFTSMRNDFSNSFNSVINELSSLIEIINNTKENKKEEDEESPASLISNKIININKGETYLLDQDACMKLIEWIGNESKFELLYRASRDGFSCQDFHRLCDNKGPTVVVLRNEFDKIIGGYSPCDWDGNVTYDYTYMQDLSNTSFLFSLTLGIKYKIKTNNYAISNSANHGPKYGGGHDLEIVSNCNINKNQYSGLGHTYELIGSKDDFYGHTSNRYTISEYEVYRVI